MKKLLNLLLFYALVYINGEKTSIIGSVNVGDIRHLMTVMLFHHFDM